ncbi:MAG: hypothetical protein MUF22_09425 [Chitinispirillaceae bacterium]|nr:hypothetical protein [Chitinispirillaceae bacterium]
MASAAPVRVICPYGGLLGNTLAMPDRGVNMRESAAIYGFFSQWVDLDRFQANEFLYACPHVNYSTVYGASLSADAYFFRQPGFGKTVAGLGLELILVRLNTTDEIVRTGDIDPIHRFDLTNVVFAPFLRAGYRFEHRFGQMRASIFPWAGIQQEVVRGDMYLEPTALWTTVFPAISEPIREDNTYGLAGIGLGINLFHFIDLEAKFHRMLNEKNQYDHFSAMVNLFLSRRFGVSYRYRNMEMSVGTNRFHLFGIAVML